MLCWENLKGVLKWLEMLKNVFNDSNALPHFIWNVLLL